MEMSLRLHIFDVNDDIVKKIIIEATKPFNHTENNVNMVRSINFYDCTSFFISLIY